MSRENEKLTAMQVMLATLDLETIEMNLFRGNSPQVGWQRVLRRTGDRPGADGGAAHSGTRAACAFVARLFHALPGDPSVPILYQVDRLRDGSSFNTRRVLAIQHGKAIFALTASFQIDEPGFEHQGEMPKVPAPEELMDEQQIKEHYIANAPENVRRYWERKRAIEIRPVSLDHYFSRSRPSQRQDIWVRLTGPVPGDRVYQNAVLAYLSDMTLLDAALHAHGTSIFDQGLQVASLDHAMWFHRPFKLDDWLLYTQDSPSAFRRARPGSR